VRKVKKIPILLPVFNRPETTDSVIGGIRAARPQRLTSGLSLSGVGADFENKYSCNFRNSTILSDGREPLSPGASFRFPGPAISLAVRSVIYFVERPVINLDGRVGDFAICRLHGVPRFGSGPLSHTVPKETPVAMPLHRDDGANEIVAQ
jgi:hypothetical protein